MTAPRDRRAALTASGLNGIDFIEVVDPAQTQLRVHFLEATPVADKILAATITGGDTIPSVAVHPIAPADWDLDDDDDDDRPTLDLRVDAPGDFSSYQLTLVPRDPADPGLDRYFDHVAFSFKAGCPSTLDCEPRPHACPVPDEQAPTIDYLAKDAGSFKRALLELSAQRYPGWQERSEADFGVMFAEALASVADDLSYLQDRIAAEGWLETATERRSIVRLARLVDYEPRVATAAHVVVQLAMDAPGAIPPGTPISALAPDGALVEFETGTGLADREPRAVDPAWNAIQPWWFDDADRTLPCGATEMWVQRPARALAAGQVLVIETAGPSSADPPIRARVTLVEAALETDALFGQALTRIAWRPEDALRVAHDLTRSVLGGNLVPATHGRRRLERFVIGDGPAALAGPPRATVRTGANASVQYLHALRDAPLAWLAQDDPDEAPRPELALIETSRGAPDTWTWRRGLLGARPLERVFTIEAMRYRALDAAGDFLDYDGSDGETVRFGDGTQGAIPEVGMAFELVFRVGGGARGNVAAGALTRLDAQTRAALGIASVTNPFPAEGGRDAEPDAQVRELAPQRFRARPLRVVRTRDYEDAAASLAWVQRAGTRFRYTGSWLTAFTSVDPRASEVLPDDRTLELTRLLDRRRLAGYESFVLPPRFASLDLDVTLCVRPDAFRGDVERAVRAALDTTVHRDGALGFFHPDRFTFGAALERSALEAALQAVPGVDGVIEVRYRRRGHTRGLVAMPDAVEVGADEIVRVDGDPDRPERGSLRLQLRGGK